MPKIVDKIEKRGNILEAAIRVFSRKGRVCSKISDIAEEAGIGKGTIYEYFQSKDEIFYASFVFLMEKQEEVISRRLSRIDDPLEKIRAYFSAWTEILEGPYLDYLAIVIAFWAEGVMNEEESGRIDLGRIYSENIEILQSLLTECVARGEIKSVDTRLIAATMLGALDGLMVQWIMDRNSFEIKKAIKLFVDTMIEGLIRPK